MNTLDFISQNKVITICRRVYGEDLLKLADALYAGGIKMIEVTFDQADPDCIEKTGECIRALCDRFGDKMMFGAGTVLNAEQVEAAAKAGARYIISPNVDADVIAKTKELGLVSMPGAMTPSEILTAHKLGADIVKLFPAGYLGFGYIKDILGPISHVKLCATGGVTEAVLRRLCDDEEGPSLDAIADCGVRGEEGIREFVVPYKGMEVRMCVASGLENARKVLDAVKSGEKSYHFIEVMACPGGCVMGGGQPIYGTKATRVTTRRAGLYAADGNMAIKKSNENPLMDVFYNGPFKDKTHELLHTSHHE